MVDTRKHDEHPSQAGVTLVELMVASVVLGLSLTATLSMLRTGMDLEYKKNVERQAYRLAYAALENSAYHYWPGYNTMVNSEEPRQINISNRQITANVYVDVFPELSETWPMSSTTFWRRVDARVNWTIEGASESIRVSKIVAEVR